MSKRATRALIAAETMRILEAGEYSHASGAVVSIRESQQRAVDESIHYPPHQHGELGARCDEILRERRHAQTQFEVRNETTFAAARRLIAADPSLDPCALNFASARNPGGGFLGGSQAQEESLARASGLYPCIAQMGGYYDTNRAFDSCLYTDHMIYCPRVPVFRDDADELLAAPVCVSILTAPAVNAGAVKQNEPDHVGRIEETMRGRIEKLLNIAVVHGHNTLILGAWGCGVFRNDPREVAGWFAEQLRGEGRFSHAFARVVFAVLDREADLATIAPFEAAFA